MIKRVAARKKRKKVKFRKLVLKVSDKQNKQIQRLSTKKHTSSNKLIKAAIREYLIRHADLLVEEPSYVTKNQLKLFDFSESPAQLDMFEEKK
jgi:hypothetical protein